MSVATLFEDFCTELTIGTSVRSTISTRYLAICTRLNKDFWNYEGTSGGRYVGSFGRNTANNRVSDIDMLFEMPSRLYTTYDGYVSNGQSSFLQGVKNSIAKTYPNTNLRGDGQVVRVKFNDNMEFDVLPVFSNDGGHYTFADSNSGGSWKVTDPIPEINAVSNGDTASNCNLRPLCRMMCAWKYFCDVPIKGLLLDTLAYRFITEWPYRDKSYLYYDWMTRDFFEYLKGQSENQTIWYALGSGKIIINADNFRYKSTVALNKTKEAMQLLSEGKENSAKSKWGEIYGNRFPT